MRDLARYYNIKGDKAHGPLPLDDATERMRDGKGSVVRHGNVFLWHMPHDPPETSDRCSGCKRH